MSNFKNKIKDKWFIFKLKVYKVYKFIAQRLGKKFYTIDDIPRIVKITTKNPPEYDVYIGRKNIWINLEASIWGNPFHLKKESEREKVIKDHMDYLKKNKFLLRKLKDLSGKTLGCYCCNYSFQENYFNGKRCHGMNIVQMYIKHVLKKDVDIFE